MLRVNAVTLRGEGRRLPTAPDNLLIVAILIVPLLGTSLSGIEQILVGIAILLVPGSLVLAVGAAYQSYRLRRMGVRPKGAKTAAMYKRRPSLSHSAGPGTKRGELIITAPVGYVKTEEQRSAHPAKY
jgi:hypothetical protein